MIFPYTIFLIRAQAWALESPIAEITILCYSLLMIVGGVFTLISYQKWKIQQLIMKLCLVINGLYALVGFVILMMLLFQNV